MELIELARQSYGGFILSCVAHDVFGTTYLYTWDLSTDRLSVESGVNFSRLRWSSICSRLYMTLQAVLSYVNDSR